MQSRPQSHLSRLPRLEVPLSKNALHECEWPLILHVKLNNTEVRGSRWTQTPNAIANRTQRIALRYLIDQSSMLNTADIGRQLRGVAWQRGYDRPASLVPGLPVVQQYQHVVVVTGDFVTIENLTIGLLICFTRNTMIRNCNVHRIMFLVDRTRIIELSFKYSGKQADAFRKKMRHGSYDTIVGKWHYSNPRFNLYDTTFGALYYNAVDRPSRRRHKPTAPSSSGSVRP